MPGSILWQSGQTIFYSPQLSGQGLSLTNGTMMQCSGDLYNNGVSGGPAFVGNFLLVGAQSGFGANVQAGANIDLYLVPSISGGVFSTAATSGLPYGSFRGSFLTPVSGNVTRVAMDVQNVPLAPIRYQVWLQNGTGQTLASGWSVFFEGFNEYYT